MFIAVPGTERIFKQTAKQSKTLVNVQCFTQKVMYGLSAIELTQKGMRAWPTKSKD